MSDKINKPIERTCVYEVLMGSEIVYIGIADNPKERWRHHRANKRFPKTAKFRIYKWYSSTQEAMSVEGIRQRELLPRMCRKIEGGSPKGYRVRPWNDNMHRIRQLVREQGYSFKDVGVRYGVSAQTVSRHLKKFETKNSHLFNQNTKES